jgi:hypothetical protein
MPRRPRTAVNIVIDRWRKAVIVSDGGPALLSDTVENDETAAG